ncbi:helix-turn-helix transcriptional regulator [Streptomyces sp. NBC_01304]|uniref:helix-turn-helix transcriptional regulator n=1 Tax=Streptomyces sp. NBC_01304 TaxID=2903818 RepID=UPI002E0E26B3|nr:helix-turn-helix domain-containing protein [Streptomyces sp. NBC_01304]
MGQKPNVLTPYESSAHYLGARMREWRGELSLANLAARTNFHSTYLGRSERGQQLPSIEMVTAYDRAVGAGGVLVQLRQDIENGIDIRAYDAADGANSGLHGAKAPATLADKLDAQTPWTGEAISLPILHEGKVTFVSVPRRAFFGLSAAAALTAAVPSTALASTDGAPPLIVPDAHPIQHLRDMRRLLIDMDNVMGPRSVLQKTTEQIHVIQTLIKTRTGTDQRELKQLRTQYAEFLGWAHQDAGDFRAAQYWTDRALEWSYSSGDPDLTVYVLARKAQLAGDMGDPMLAIDNGEAARAMARPDTKLPAVAAVYSAHGFALQKNAAAAHRAYDEALELISSRDLDPASNWGVWLDAAYIEVHRARSLEALGQHQEAAAGFAKAISDLPSGYTRDRGVYLAREAVAYAGAGEPDRAAQIGIEALSVGASTQSARILTELAHLDTALTRWHTVTDVAQFHEVLRSTIPQSA